VIWLRIEGSPVRQIIRNADALPYIDPKIATHTILATVGTLRSTGRGDENANVSIGLTNADMQASNLFATRPPIGAPAVLMRGSVEVFRGVISGIGLNNPEASIEIEA